MSDAINISDVLMQDERSAEEQGAQEREFVKKISGLPLKILQHYATKGLPSLLLHELGHNPMFNIKKACYLIDNPDFDHLVGVTGFCKTESLHQGYIWDDLDASLRQIEAASFYQKVRKFSKNSLKRRETEIEIENEIARLAGMFELGKHTWVSWPLRHGNHGILIFEQGSEPDEIYSASFRSLSALLGLCATDIE